MATPASILNIGTGSGQNHFSVQIAPNGSSSIQTHSLAEIATGYSDATHFFATPDNLWVGFKPRADGPTTSGTSYARDELREVNADGSNAKWDALVGEHIMQGRTKIVHTPDNDPDVVIAQLHNGDADRISIRTQMFSTGIVVLGVRINGTLHATRFENPWPGEGHEFDWKIRLIDGLAEIYYEDMDTPLITSSSLVQTTHPDGWYWKAGAYNQFNESDTGATDLSVAASEYSEVHLRNLSVTHGIGGEPEMAVLEHHLTTDGTTTGGTVYTTASISPNPSRPILCAVMVSATAPTPTVTVAGCGVTWVLEKANASGTQPIHSRTIHVFRALGTPTTGVLTITAASALTSCIWKVVEFSGADTSGTNGSGAIAQSVAHRSSDIDADSDSKAFDNPINAGNIAFAAVGLHSVQEALTPGTGWTAVGQQFTVSAPQSSFMGMVAKPAVQNIAASWTTLTDDMLVGIEIKAAAGDSTAPTAPASISVVANSATQVGITWTASTDAGGLAASPYRVRRNGVDLATGISGLSYTDNTAQPSTAYSYTVSAVDAAGNRSAESIAGTVTTPAASKQRFKWNGTELVVVGARYKWNGTELVEIDGDGDTGADTTPPTTPTGLATTLIEPTKIIFKWNASTDNVSVDGYRIRRNGTILGGVTGTATTITGLSPSTSYSFTVQAYDESGNDSPESAPLVVSTSAVTDTTKPSVPTGLTATPASSQRIDLAWNPSTDNVAVSHYVVLRGGEVIDPEVNGTQYAAIGLAPSTSYSFTVQAVDSSGNISNETAPVSATTPANSTNPDPVPTSGFVIGVTSAQLASAPKNNAEWANLLRQADAPYSFTATDGATDGSGNAVAGALVYLATGNTAYKNRVITQLNQVQAFGGTWQHAARSRKLGGWALAGHLVGHQTTAWHSYLRNQLTVTGTGGNDKSNFLNKASWAWDNNHGGAAMGTYVMICAILGIKSSNETTGGYPGGLFHANKWLRGFLGDHSGTGFPHVNNTDPPYGAMGVTGEAQNRGWHMDESKPYGVGPTSNMWGSAVPSTREGANPADVIRGTTANHPTVGGDAHHYMYGNVGRRSVAAIVLAAQGYPEIWTCGDDAFYRFRAWCQRMGVPPQGANNMVYDPIFKKVYRNKYNTTGFTATSEQSEVITGTEWLALIPTWPIRPASLA